MLYRNIGVTFVYNFALKKSVIVEGGGFKLTKIGDGQRKLRGGQP